MAAATRSAAVHLRWASLNLPQQSTRSIPTERRTEDDLITVFVYMDDITAYLHLCRPQEVVRTGPRGALITSNFALFGG